MNSYKGASLFNDVKNMQLQAWNRLQVANNLVQDGRRDDSESYLALVSEGGQAAMGEMVKLIHAHGIEGVKRAIIRGINV
jgi:hypothetical protein